MQKFIIYSAVICVVTSLIFGGGKGSVTLGPGVKAPDDPVQRNISSPVPISHKGLTIIPLADYTLTAKILSRKNYRSGRESEISPFDFALGWGNMSDQAVVDQLQIGQSGRWFDWTSPGAPPVPMNEIKRSCANVHIIPANDRTEMMLDQMKKGEIVTLRGKLVRVESADGWHWESSLTRTDTGASACEVFYVEGGIKRSL